MRSDHTYGTGPALSSGMNRPFLSNKEKFIRIRSIISLARIEAKTQGLEEVKDGAVDRLVPLRNQMIQHNHGLDSTLESQFWFLGKEPSFSLVFD